MSAIDIRIPETKWSMLEWKTTKEKPIENTRVLIYTGKEVIGGRYLQGDYVAQNWGQQTEVTLWAKWPTAPKW
jgi:hypothetical protein